MLRLRCPLVKSHSFYIECKGRFEAFMESSWLGPAFPEFHIYLNQIRAKHSPVRHPLQPLEQQGFLENMNTFVQIKR